MPGFSTSDDLTCNDVNECAINNLACPEESVCIDVVGSYACICETGQFKIKST